MRYTVHDEPAIRFKSNVVLMWCVSSNAPSDRVALRDAAEDNKKNGFKVRKLKPAVFLMTSRRRVLWVVWNLLIYDISERFPVRFLFVIFHKTDED